MHAACALLKTQLLEQIIAHAVALWHEHHLRARSITTPSKRDI